MKSYKERMQAKEAKQLAILAASIQKTMELNRKFAFELQYGKINLN
jgi:hypothetical protein